MHLGHTVAGGASALLPCEPQRVYLQHTWALPHVLLVMCKCLEILTVSLKNFSWLKVTCLRRGWRSTQGNHWRPRDCKHRESEQGPGVEVSQGHTAVSSFSWGAWRPAAHLLVWPGVPCSVQGHLQNAPGPVLWELLLGDAVLGNTLWPSPLVLARQKSILFCQLRDQEFRGQRKEHSGYVSVLAEQAVGGRTAKTRLTGKWSARRNHSSVSTYNLHLRQWLGDSETNSCCCQNGLNTGPGGLIGQCFKEKLLKISCKAHKAWLAFFLQKWYTCELSCSEESVSLSVETGK